MHLIERRVVVRFCKIPTSSEKPSEGFFEIKDTKKRVASPQFPKISPSLSIRKQTHFRHEQRSGHPAFNDFLENPTRFEHLEYENGAKFLINFFFASNYKYCKSNYYPKMITPEVLNQVVLIFRKLPVDSRIKVINWLQSHPFQTAFVIVQLIKELFAIFITDFMNHAPSQLSYKPNFEYLQRVLNAEDALLYSKFLGECEWRGPNDIPLQFFENLNFFPLIQIKRQDAKVSHALLKQINKSEILKKKKIFQTDNTEFDSSSIKSISSLTDLIFTQNILKNHLYKKNPNKKLLDCCNSYFRSRALQRNIYHPNVIFDAFEIFQRYRNFKHESLSFMDETLTFIHKFLEDEPNELIKKIDKNIEDNLHMPSNLLLSIQDQFMRNDIQNSMSQETKLSLSLYKSHFLYLYLKSSDLIDATETIMNYLKLTPSRSKLRFPYSSDITLVQEDGKEVDLFVMDNRRKYINFTQITNGFSLRAIDNFRFEKRNVLELETPLVYDLSKKKNCFKINIEQQLETLCPEESKKLRHFPLKQNHN